jgi:membrane protease YdiL (CAAX protease family)
VYKKSEKFTFKVVNDNLFLTAIVFAVLSALVYLQSKFVELYQLNSTQLLLFTVGSFIVGFFEETLFRGLLLAKLQKTLSRLQSLIIMSAVFAFYHYGMQPLSAFPFLFMFGILTGQLANLRVSLFWLGIFHGIYDTMWGIWYPATSIPYAFKIVEFITVCILNVAVFYYSKSIYVRKTQINTNATY